MWRLKISRCYVARGYMELGFKSITRQFNIADYSLFRARIDVTSTSHRCPRRDGVRYFSNLLARWRERERKREGIEKKSGRRERIRPCPSVYTWKQTSFAEPRMRRSRSDEKRWETGRDGIKLQNSFAVNNERKVRFEEMYSRRSSPVFLRGIPLLVRARVRTWSAGSEFSVVPSKRISGPPSAAGALALARYFFSLSLPLGFPITLYANSCLHSIGFEINLIVLKDGWRCTYVYAYMWMRVYVCARVTEIMLGIVNPNVHFTSNFFLNGLKIKCKKKYSVPVVYSPLICCTAP